MNLDSITHNNESIYVRVSNNGIGNALLPSDLNYLMLDISVYD